jgi:hypothetical protein
MTDPRERVPSHANLRLMNPLFEPDERLEGAAEWLTVRDVGGSGEVHPRLPRQRVESWLRDVPWLVVLMVAALLFGILGLAANFVSMAGGS